MSEVQEEMVDCPRCDGEGEEYPVTVIGLGLQPDPQTCTLCRGVGQVQQWLRGWYEKNGGVFRG